MNLIKRLALYALTFAAYWYFLLLILNGNPERFCSIMVTLQIFLAMFHIGFSFVLSQGKRWLNAILGGFFGIAGFWTAIQVVEGWNIRLTHDSLGILTGILIAGIVPVLCWEIWFWTQKALKL